MIVKTEGKQERREEGLSVSFYTTIWNKFTRGRTLQIQRPFFSFFGHHNEFETPSSSKEIPYSYSHPIHQTYKAQKICPLFQSRAHRARCSKA